GEIFDEVDHEGEGTNSQDRVVGNLRRCLWSESSALEPSATRRLVIGDERRVREVYRRVQAGNTWAAHDQVTAVRIAADEDLRPLGLLEACRHHHEADVRVGNGYRLIAYVKLTPEVERHSPAWHQHAAV